MFNQELTITIFGIRRSGNHLLSSWILDNCPGPCVFVNNINGHGTIDFPKMPINLSAERPFYDVLTVKGLPYFRVKTKTSSFIRWLVFRPENYSLVPSDSSVNWGYLKKAKKKIFMYSLEDITWRDYRLLELERSLNGSTNKSTNRISLILLRDPYNMFASLLKSGMMQRTKTDGDKYKNLFKEYAIGFLEHEPLSTKQQLVYVNYNDMISRKDYRSSLGKFLGLLPDAERLSEKVPTQGGGSSFDQLKFNKKASSMRVNDRWKYFKNDDFYLSLFDNEVIDLSNKIFGDVTNS